MNTKNVSVILPLLKTPAIYTLAIDALGRVIAIMSGVNMSYSPISVYPQTGVLSSVLINFPPGISWPNPQTTMVIQDITYMSTNLDNTYSIIYAYQSGISKPVVQTWANGLLAVGLVSSNVSLNTAKAVGEAVNAYPSLPFTAIVTGNPGNIQNASRNN